MKNKVSVVIPCFNDGLYIEETVQSVMNQTHRNLEIVIVDDGSTDVPTANKLDEIKDKYPATVIRSKNGGPAAARNLGIRNASGDFILPLDADDLIDPTYVDKALNVLESNPHVGFVYCKAEMFGERQGYWDLPEFSIEQFAWDNVVFNAALFRKSDWERAGGYNESLVHGSEDYDFWVSLVHLGLVPYRIPEILFRYRIKAKSRSTEFSSTSLESKVETYHRIFSNNPEFFMKNMIHIFRKRALLEKNILLHEHPRFFFKNLLGKILNPY